MDSHPLIFLSGRSFWLLLVLLTITAHSGCVRRRMTVRSNPPGAVVFVDERRLGVTPVSTSFTYYGTRDVRLMKDGFETVTEEHKFATPWYQFPVIDFFAENVWPFEVRDERILDFDLPPQRSVPPTQVIQSAEQLRGEAQRGLVTPMVQPVP
ncbi:MAG: PEGA domain-containing protein [Pirellulaceae bacterium]